jgi:hypothetical protein
MVVVIDGNSCWIGRSCADVKCRSWRAEEKEDRDPQPQDLSQISRKNEGRQIRQKLRGRYSIGKSQGEIPIESGPSNPERIRTVDHSSVRIGVRDFEMSKSLVNENPEIAKRDIAIQSQPLIQAEIVTIHV